MTGAVNARSKRQQEKWRFESAVANESTDLLLTLGDSDDAEKKTAASTITKVVSWNDAWVSTFGDYAKTATVKLTGTEAVNKIIVSENGALTNERTVELSNSGILGKGGSLINRGTLKLAAVSTLELENPVGFDNSKGRLRRTSTWATSASPAPMPCFSAGTRATRSRRTRTRTRPSARPASTSAASNFSTAPTSPSPRTPLTAATA